MANRKVWLDINQPDKTIIISGGGFWTVDHLAELQTGVDRIKPGDSSQAEINLSGIERMDTAGAYLALQMLGKFGDSSSYQLESNSLVEAMLETVTRYRPSADQAAPRTNALFRRIEKIGAATIEGIAFTAGFVSFIGEIFRLLGTALLHPRRFRFGQTINQIELSGFNAIPIISLISFLIGIVIAYQGALQLGKLGADVYTIDLLAVTILREMGILLSAIVIAGRSGSTFAAEIGSMKLNEELDAMQTIGMDPMEVLVLPRVIGLIISLPILTLIANAFGIFGGGLMVWLVMDIGPTLFLHKLINSLAPWTFWVGLSKAPVFAAVIAAIGCYEGMQVAGSAESLGNHTTRAVVEAIFLIIVFDALFSIFFGVIGI
jgi:phospholipid/cholesterol/gamma-HCH transport system permease protein